MASKVGEETVEAKTMRKHYADLTLAIQDPNRLAAQLYSDDVIARGVLDSTIGSSSGRFDISMYLLQVVSDRITADPKVYHDFVAILRKDSSLQTTADLMNTTYDDLRRNQGGFTGGQGETNEEGIQFPKRLKLSCATEGGQHVFVKKKCQDIRLSWKQCCPLPITMSVGRAVANGNSVYVHDYHGSSKIYEYEISKNIWCNEIQCPRLFPSLTVVNELLTVVGGFIAMYSGYNTLLSLVESPKDGTKQWSELLKPMHKGRHHPVSTCNGEYLVVAGGTAAKHSVEVMTINTQEWRDTILPKNDGDIGSATIIGDNLYITFVHASILSSCSVVTSSLTKLAENSTPTQSVVKPLLWHKLQGPPLYKACTVQLCGNLLAIGANVTKEYDYKETKNVYQCNGSAYAFDEEKGKWVLVCRLPSEVGFPDHEFVIAGLSDERMIVIGGTQYTNNEDEDPPHSDIVHVGSVL